MSSSPLPSQLRFAACLDLETSGLDPSKDHVLEVAVVLVDLRWDEIVASHATLLPAPGNAAEHINRIPSRLVASLPPRGTMLEHEATFAGREGLLGCGDWRWEPVVNLVREADVVLAHRAKFDYSFTPEGVRRLVPWACSKFGFPWRAPAWKHGGHLTELALAHGLPVMSNHRAIEDALLLAKVLCLQGKGNPREDLSLEFEAAVALGPNEPFRCVCGDWTFVLRGEQLSPLPAFCPKHGGPKDWPWRR